MRTIKFFFFLAAAFFACANLPAQVTIGSLDAPRAGALLDLNSGAKGGLLLSNVNITNLDSIPAGTGYFPGVNTPALRDVNPELRGAIVYNTNETTGTGVYVWNGKRWWQAATPDNEQIAITVRTTDGNYAIPTAGIVGGTYSHSYDWDITVDGQPAGADGHYTGTGGGTFDGIPLALGNGDHQIRITPHGGADPGWGNAFGYCDSIKGAHTPVNKQKLISIDAPLTTMAFAPKIAEANSKINASYMFAFLFTRCFNLTTPVVIKDTYKLPETITNLSSFLAYTHSANSALAAPIDLAPLKDWFNGNNSITDLSNFLYNIHYNNNALVTSIDLAPLSGWFKGNTSITYLSNFLYSIHYGYNALVTPINLAPLKDWFNGNNSIEYVGNFLSNIHASNSHLEVPINLTPFFGWFKGNTSIKNLSGFLGATHYINTTLTDPIDLEPLSGWFKGNTSITNLSSFLINTHAINSALDKPIDLEPLKDWFSGNNTISNLLNFLAYTCNGNITLTDPIDLEPLSGWFKDNTSITNLSNFLALTHNSNTALTKPINLMPLKDWFPTGRSIDNLTGFLSNTHYFNPGLTLSDQKIFPNWIKTMKQTQDAKDIWDVPNAFFRTFSLSIFQSQTGTEPLFEDGSTTLSSLGNPTVPNLISTDQYGISTYTDNKGTYRNRNIVPYNGHNSWIDE